MLLLQLSPTHSDLCMVDKSLSLLWGLIHGIIYKEHFCDQVFHTQNMSLFEMSSLCGLVWLESLSCLKWHCSVSRSLMSVCAVFMLSYSQTASRKYAVQIKHIAYNSTIFLCDLAPLVPFDGKGHSALIQLRLFWVMTIILRWIISNLVWVISARKTSIGCNDFTNVKIIRVKQCCNISLKNCVLLLQYN